MEPEFALCFEGRVSKELLETGVTVHQLGEVRTRKPWTVWSARAHSARATGPRTIRRSDLPHGLAHGNVREYEPPFGAAAGILGARRGQWEALAGAMGQPRVTRYRDRQQPVHSHHVPLVVSRRAVQASFFVQCCPRSRPTRKAAGPRSAELWKLPIDTVAIIQVSRMEAWKGHHLQLDALAKLKDDPRWICWMVGGAQRPAEQEYMREVQRESDRAGNWRPGAFPRATLRCSQPARGRRHFQSAEPGSRAFWNRLHRGAGGRTAGCDHRHGRPSGNCR